MIFFFSLNHQQQNDNHLTISKNCSMTPPFAENNVNFLLSRWHLEKLAKLYGGNNNLFLRTRLRR